MALEIVFHGDEVGWGVSLENEVYREQNVLEDHQQQHSNHQIDLLRQYYQQRSTPKYR